MAPARAHLGALLVAAVVFGTVASAAPVSASSEITWSVKGAPDTKASHCGFQMAPNVSSFEVYRATLTGGAYNHGVMLDWHQDNMLLTWKNSHRDEDTPGQRILFSQSLDGQNWTAHAVMFPSVSSSKNPAALFAAPTVILNGNRYAVASPHQFCLFPAPTDSPVLMRKVGTGVPAGLGPMFWYGAIPKGFEDASKKQGIVALDEMDKDTQEDIKLLSDDSRLPCDTTASTKCEACKDGCDYTPQPPPGALGIGGGGEYTRYTVPSSTQEVILHRTKGHLFTASTRAAPGQPWSNASSTQITDARSNLNAGTLPDGRIYLTSNVCPNGSRDPLVLSTSQNGLDFNKAVGIMTCKALDGQCKPRYKGRAKNPGQAYPQAVAVTSPAGMAYLWVAATNNKEDVWVSRVPYDAF